MQTAEQQRAAFEAAAQSSLAEMRAVCERLEQERNEWAKRCDAERLEKKRVLRQFELLKAQKLGDVDIGKIFVQTLSEL